MAHIAVIDNDPAMLGITATLSRIAGHAIFPYENLATASERQGEDQWTAAVLDLRLVPVEDLAELEQFCRRWPVLLTWSDDPGSGWERIVQAGPYGYLRKPYHARHLARHLDNLLEHLDLKRQVSDTKTLLRRRYGLKRIVGNHPEIQRIVNLIERVGNSTANVLITGASGTGKSLLARVIHQNSPWSDGDFLEIDCESIEEAHLREKVENRLRETRGQGIGTTFYLENVGVLSREVQDWLAQVISEHQAPGNGLAEAGAARMRFIGSSRLNLGAEEDNRHFSRDLYCCLAQVQMDLPTLAERSEDIPLLVKHFLRGRRTAGAAASTPGAGGNLTAAPTVVRLLQNHEWPDNIRELRHVIDQAATICDGEIIQLQDLPRNLINGSNGDSPASMALELDSGKSLGEITREIEQQCIRTMIDRCVGDREQAAKALGISLATLYRKLDLKEKKKPRKPK